MSERLEPNEFALAKGGGESSFSLRMMKMQFEDRLCVAQSRSPALGPGGGLRLRLSDQLNTRRARLGKISCVCLYHVEMC